MTRIKSSVTHKRRVKKVLSRSKGFYGRRKNVYSVAKQNVIRAGVFSFAHRRKKKGDFRRLWQVRINAALRSLWTEENVSERMTYSRFIHQLQKAGVHLNRKALAYLAIHDSDGFKHLVQAVRLV